MARASIEDISIPLGHERLRGTLLLPVEMRGLALLALRSVHSPRAQVLVRHLRDRGLGTLCMPLLTPEEEERDRLSAELRFNVRLMAQRILYQIALVEDRIGHRSNCGLVASSTLAAGALVAAAHRPDVVRALVLQGGRPELAVFALPDVQAATLLLVGSNDEPCIHANQIAALRMTAPHQLQVIEGAGHRFEEPGKLEQVADLTASWLQKNLHHRPSSPAPAFASSGVSSLADADENVATKYD